VSKSKVLHFNAVDSEVFRADDDAAEFSSMVDVEKKKHRETLHRALDKAIDLRGEGHGLKLGDRVENSRDGSRGVVEEIIGPNSVGVRPDNGGITKPWHTAITKKIGDAKRSKLHRALDRAMDRKGL
jgi:hypothetical protein